MEETWVRELTVVRGPFKFFYTAVYKAGEDGFWKLVSFKKNGYDPIAKYPLSEKIELVKKFGRQAYRAAAEECEKKIKLPSKAR